MEDLARFESYAHITDGFRWDISERYNIAAAVLAGREDDHQTVAIVEHVGGGAPRSFSFHDLAVRTEQVAAYLRSIGVDLSLIHI